MTDKTIDPARVGISKSLVCTPCERKGWYGETVRDAHGRRLRFPMPERVTFGQAVDSAHAAIVAAARADEPYSVAMGVAAGMDRLDSPSSGPIDVDLFEHQLTVAMTRFLAEPDGLARLPLPGIRIQGDDGRSLGFGDAIGTPDYLLGDLSVVDVKTSSRRYGPDKFYRSPEMGFYAYLVAGAFDGVIPPRLAYQVYVRSAQPFWQWIETPGTADLVALGAQHLGHWRALMAAGRVELAAIDTTFCGDCPWRAPLPEYGHDGCPVGSRVPVEEVA